MLYRGHPADQLLFALLLAAVCLPLHSDAGGRRRLSLRMRQLPARTLWVWERPEDLSHLDPATTAIACLDQTIEIGDRVTAKPRRQSFLYPASVRRIAVVRIEVEPGAPVSGDAGRTMMPDVVTQIMETVRQPSIVALQIDFDATLSQRAFYAELLGQLRARMPEELPLSITALASWCSSDDWIGALPVDEAVPMYFRMEPDRRRAPADRPEFCVREPLCMGSVGVSTHERWPADMAGKRIYIFADRGWREDLPLLASRRLP